MKILRSWREQKIMLKQRFSVLMDFDFEYAEGQREKMMERLSQILKKDREELDFLFEELQTY
ncbi:hypothetical protein [Algoriphagus halophilus]|uniref:General stress protein CsbD n=1 Tax=Algoriphagus halophilus TaxID=226505 RepID=A0A1N6DZ87_9BACT|nr:hypothetical protein [Algoriphagus halophilus]SIN76072.1 hypothetical protein SAMN05444394_1553 [Algoriphagus halophilus]